MKSIFKETVTLSTLPTVIEQLKGLKSQCTIFTFTGLLGAGKTTIIRELLRSWGVKAPITSPTFNYVNAYQNAKGEHFYHFDLYRIESLEEFVESGFDEYLYAPDSWVLIEWPDVIEALLKEHVCAVSIEQAKDSSQRIVSCQIS
jgi:tRNA threonylcarbamoyladenosine biosynthesis protein TsaE